MAKPAITVENIGKQYKIGLRERIHTTLGEALTDIARAPWRRLRALRETSSGADMIWALKDISFEVNAGEVVGIIGRNGAGKSTLLKILSRITEPTTGRAIIRGRLRSLLEIGTGFHPELTGRENIYLNGAILGMKRAEIERKFDEIVAFAEVEKFLDTPVKRYSSGMRVRLGFSVAAHLEPEILIVDEVLAVGDAGFQKKCLTKMGDVAQEGRTVLFVSHNMAAVRRLCQWAILLDNGTAVAEGTTDDIVTRHLTSLLSNQNPNAIWIDKWNPPEYRDSFGIDSVETVLSDGTASSVFTMDQGIYVQVTYRVMQPFESVRFSMHLKTVDGIFVLSSTDADTLSSHGRPRLPGRFVTRCRIPGNLLAPRQYVINLGAYIRSNEIISGGESVVSFEVLETGGPIVGKMQGVISPLLEWQLEDRTVG
jgi:lipopolysaccharide transport system ATP-binding protein